ADIAKTALLAEQCGDIHDPLCDDNAGAWSIPSVIRTQLHSGALSRISSVRWVGKVRGGYCLCVRDYALGLAHVNGGLGAIGGRHGSDGVLVVPVARPRIRRGLAQQAVPQSAIEAALVQIVFDREVLSGHDLLPVSRIMAWPGKSESTLGLRQAVQR